MIIHKTHIKQHSIFKSIIFHLSPGVLIVLFYIVFAPILTNKGFPSLFVAILSYILILIPFQLGVLLWYGKKTNGFYSLRNIITYNERLSLGSCLFFITLLVAWTAIIFVLNAKFLSGYFSQIFSWLPDWYSKGLENTDLYSKPILMAIWILSLIVMPASAIIEELYFRGFLLPRISRFGCFAPVINTALFAVYHLDIPLDIFRVFVMMLPVTYVVWVKRNILIGILTHLIVNLLSVFMMSPIIFN